MSWTRLTTSTELSEGGAVERNYNYHFKLTEVISGTLPICSDSSSSSKPWKIIDCLSHLLVRIQFALQFQFQYMHDVNWSRKLSMEKLKVLRHVRLFLRVFRSSLQLLSNSLSSWYLSFDISRSVLKVLRLVDRLAETYTSCTGWNFRQRSSREVLRACEKQFDGIRVHMMGGKSARSEWVREKKAICYRSWQQWGRECSILYALFSLVRIAERLSKRIWEFMCKFFI